MLDEDASDYDDDGWMDGWMDMDDGLLLPFRGLVVWDYGIVLWNNVVFGLHRWLYTSYIICSLFFVSKEEEMMGSRILVVACMYTTERNIYQELAVWKLSRWICLLLADYLAVVGRKMRLVILPMGG